MSTIISTPEQASLQGTNAQQIGGTVTANGSISGAFEFDLTVLARFSAVLRGMIIPTRIPPNVMLEYGWALMDGRTILYSQYPEAEQLVGVGIAFGIAVGSGANRGITLTNMSHTAMQTNQTTLIAQRSPITPQIPAPSIMIGVDSTDGFTGLSSTTTTTNFLDTIVTFNSGQGGNHQHAPATGRGISGAAGRNLIANQIIPITITNVNPNNEANTTSTNPSVHTHTLPSLNHSHTITVEGGNTITPSPNSPFTPPPIPNAPNANQAPIPDCIQMNFYCYIGPRAGQTVTPDTTQQSMVTPSNSVVSGSTGTLTDSQILAQNEATINITDTNGNAYTLDIKPLLGLQQLILGAAMHIRGNVNSTNTSLGVPGWARLTGDTISCTRNADLVSLGYADANLDGSILLILTSTQCTVIECGTDRGSVIQQRIPAPVFNNKVAIIGNGFIGGGALATAGGHTHTIFLPLTTLGNQSGSTSTFTTLGNGLTSASGLHTHTISLPRHKHTASLSGNFSVSVTANQNFFVNIPGAPVVLRSLNSHLWVYIGDLI